MGKPKSSLQQDDLTPSTLPADHTIVKLGTAQGSSNYLSKDAEGTERLVELSGRVKRSKIIITRGEFAFIRIYAAEPEGSKSKLMGEIVGLISGRDVKSWRKTGEWPAGFDEPAAPQPETKEVEGPDSDEERIILDEEEEQTTTEDR